MSVKFHPEFNIQEDFEHLIAFYRPETDRFLYPSYLLRKKRLRKYSFIVTAFKFDLVKRDYLMTIFNGIKTFFTIPTKLIRRKARKFPLSTYGRKKHLILIRTRDLEYMTHRFLKFRNLSAKMYKNHYLFRGFLPQVRPLNKVLFFTLMQHLRRITIFAHSWSLIKKRRKRTLNILCIGFFLKLRKSKTYFRKKGKKYIRGFRKFKKAFPYRNKRYRLFNMNDRRYLATFNGYKKHRRRKYKKLHMSLWRLKKTLLLKKINQRNYLKPQKLPKQYSSKKKFRIRDKTLRSLYKLRQKLMAINELYYIRQEYRKKNGFFFKIKVKTLRRKLRFSHWLKYFSISKSFRRIQRARKTLLYKKYKKQRFIKTKRVFLKRNRTLLLYKLKTFLYKSRRIRFAKRKKRTKKNTKNNTKKKIKRKFSVKPLIEKVNDIQKYIPRMPKPLLKQHKRMIINYRRKLFHPKSKKAFFKLKRKRISKLKFIFSRRYLLCKIRARSNKKSFKHKLYWLRRYIKYLDRKQKRLRRKRWFHKQRWFRRKKWLRKKKWLEKAFYAISPGIKKLNFFQ